MDLPIHPICMLTPYLDEPDMQNLMESIRLNGQLHPIKIYKGQVVNGKNRLRACQRLDKTPWLETVEQAESDERPELVWLAMVNRAEDVDRRHLTPKDRALIVVRLMEGTGASPNKMAKVAGVGQNTVRRAIKSLLDEPEQPPPLALELDENNIIVSEKRKGGTHDTGKKRINSQQKIENRRSKKLNDLYAQASDQMGRIEAILRYLPHIAALCGETKVKALRSNREIVLHPPEIVEVVERCLATYEGVMRRIITRGKQAEVNPSAEIKLE